MCGAVLACVAVLGCSSGSEQPSTGAIFTVPTKFSQGIRATTVDVVDMGVPFGLYNRSAHTAQLRSVTIVGLPRSARLDSILAYVPAHGAVALAHGDYLKYCRKVDKFYPVTDVVAPAHSASKWNVIIAVTFTKPGLYKIAHIKLVYQSNGNLYWQYESLNTIITVKSASATSKPLFDGCP
jgi:hypothetical protein